MSRSNPVYACTVYIPSSLPQGYNSLINCLYPFDLLPFCSCDCEGWDKGNRDPIKGALWGIEMETGQEKGLFLYKTFETFVPESVMHFPI